MLYKPVDQSVSTLYKPVHQSASKLYNSMSKDFNYVYYFLSHVTPWGLRSNARRSPLEIHNVKGNHQLG